MANSVDPDQIAPGSTLFAAILNSSVIQLTIRGSGKLKQTITKLLALPGGTKKLTLSGTVRVTLCRRNCHVDPYKIETCFRAFPKFKLINAPYLYLTQIGVG